MQKNLHEKKDFFPVLPLQDTLGQTPENSEKTLSQNCKTYFNRNYPTVQTCQFPSRLYFSLQADIFSPFSHMCHVWETKLWDFYESGYGPNPIFTTQRASTPNSSWNGSRDASWGFSNFFTEWKLADSCLVQFVSQEQSVQSLEDARWDASSLIMF